MADKPLPWFRFYHEAATDSKFDVISMTTGVEWCSVFGAWSKILCIAAASPVRGSLYVTFQKRFSNDNVAAMLRFSKEQSATIMQAFIDCDMLELDEQGAYHVKNWEKRQFDSANSTKRVQEHRKRKDEALQKQPCNVSETIHSVSVSVSESSTDSSSVLDKQDPENERLDEEGAVGKLSRQFEVSSQISAYDLDKWEAACRDMFHAGVTPEVLGQVVYDMRNPQNGNRKLTVTGPWSCTKMAIGRASETKSTISLPIDQGGSF